MLVLAQLEGLGAWLVNPGLLAAGAAATSLPILIHLLNRRRFRVVEWAAMEFLLEAEQENRRRLQVENVLLLVLRCLAVFLIGMMLARPLLPSAGLRVLDDSGRIERIVLWDDSLSMQARVGNETAWDVARRRLLDLATALAEERGRNTLTIVLTSQPERPVVDAAPLSALTIDEVRARIEDLACGEGSAPLTRAVEALADRLEPEKGDASRIVYVLTDLRRTDWDVEAVRSAGGDQGETVWQLRRLAKVVQGCSVVDVAGEETENLSIVDVRPEGSIIAGVPTALEVTVKNQGRNTPNNVRLRMTPKDVLPVELTFPELKPMETATLRFPLLLGEQLTRQDRSRVPPHKVKVELVGAQRGVPDRLAADDVAYFPARLAASVSVLIIDGDPGTNDGGESYFLVRALAPDGPIASGIVPTMVTAVESAAEDWMDHQVIFVLNADRLGDAPAEAVMRLEQWVTRGGGLVLMPGDQVDEGTFNELYWKNGEGLSSLALTDVHGDETRTVWAGIQIANTRHAVFQQFEGQDNPLLTSVKVFRWWQAHGEPGQLDSSVSIAARLSDVDQSPLVAEKAWGDGRVVLFTTPADADWHNWPSDPSYLLVMQDLVRSLVSSTEISGRLLVGQPITERVDIAQYELEAQLTGPDDFQAPLKAAPRHETQSAERTSAWQIESPATTKQGFYSLALTGRDGSPETRLFAVNVSAEEGDLRRLDEGEIANLLAGTRIAFIKATGEQSLTGTGNQKELGWYLIWLVAAVLACEQVLGWWFGRWRT